MTKRGTYQQNKILRGTANFRSVLWASVFLNFIHPCTVLFLVYSLCSESWNPIITRWVLHHPKWMLKVWYFFVLSPLWFFTIFFFLVPPFSIDALLKVAGVPEKKFVTYKAFLEWAEVDENTLDQLTKEELKERVEEYRQLEIPKFTLGFYAGKIVQAAANWGKSKGKFNLFIKIIF